MSFPRVYVTDFAEIWLLEFLNIHVTLRANTFMEVISLKIAWQSLSHVVSPCLCDWFGGNLVVGVSHHSCDIEREPAFIYGNHFPKSSHMLFCWVFGVSRNKFSKDCVTNLRDKSIVYRPSPIVHRPSSIVYRPSSIVQRLPSGF